MNSVPQFIELTEQQIGEASLIADYIISAADIVDRDFIVAYGQSLAMDEFDATIYTNGIAAIFRCDAVDSKAYRQMPDVTWEAFEHAIALMVFNRVGVA